MSPILSIIRIFMKQRNKQSIPIESNRLIIEKKKLCPSSVLKTFLLEISIKLKQGTMAILIKALLIMSMYNINKYNITYQFFYFNDINKVISR